MLAVLGDAVKSSVAHVLSYVNEWKFHSSILEYLILKVHFQKAKNYSKRVHFNYSFVIRSDHCRGKKKKKFFVFVFVCLFVCFVFHNRL